MSTHTLLDEAQEMVGKTIESVQPVLDSYDVVTGFVLMFTDGSKMEITSRGYQDCSSTVVLFPH